MQINKVIAAIAGAGFALTGVMASIAPASAQTGRGESAIPGQYSKGCYQRRAIRADPNNRYTGDRRCGQAYDYGPFDSGRYPTYGGAGFGQH